MTTKEAFQRGIERTWHLYHEAFLAVLRSDHTDADVVRFETLEDVLMALTARDAKSLRTRAATRANERMVTLTGG